MRTSTRRPLWIGLLIAPLIAPLLVWLGILAFDIEFPPDFKLALWLLVTTYAVGAPLTYMITVFLGWPLYFTLSELGHLNYKTLAIGASITGGISYLSVMIVLNSHSVLLMPALAINLCAGAIMGVAVVSIFYLICRPRYA